MNRVPSLRPTPLNETRIERVEGGWVIRQRGGCLVSFSRVYATRVEAARALTADTWHGLTPRWGERP